MRTVLLPNGKTDTGQTELNTTALIAVRSIASNGWNAQTVAHYGRDRLGFPNITTLIKGTAERQKEWIPLLKKSMIIAQAIASTGCTLTAQHTTADTVLPRDIQEGARCPSVTSTNVASEE